VHLRVCVLPIREHTRLVRGWQKAKGRVKTLPLQSVISRDTFETTQRLSKAPKNAGNKTVQQ